MSNETSMEHQFGFMPQQPMANVDWTWVRIELTKAAVSGLCATEGWGADMSTKVARFAVEIAESTIAELKKGTR